MQDSSRSTSQKLPVSCLTIALIFILCATYSPGFAQESTENVVYHRSLVMGTTMAIRSRAADQPHGHHMSVLLTHFERAEVGKPPPPCGLQLAQYYRRALRERFGVVSLSTCKESQLQVDCTSEYLGQEERLFLRLKYIYQSAEEMRLDLSAYRRSRTGEETKVQVPDQLKISFAALWDELTEIASRSLR